MGDTPNTAELMKETEKQFAQTSRSSVLVDYDRYQHFLDKAEVSDEAKAEFLQAVWGFIIGFVDLGFDVHPVQESQKACGRKPHLSKAEPVSADPDVQCKHTDILKLFAQQARATTEDTKGGIP